MNHSGIRNTRPKKRRKLNSIDLESFTIPKTSYCSKNEGEGIRIWFPNKDSDGYYPAFIIQDGKVLTGIRRTEVAGKKWEKLCKILIKFSENKKNYHAYDNQGNLMKEGMTVSRLLRRLPSYRNSDNERLRVKVKIKGKTYLITDFQLTGDNGEKVLLFEVLE